ncbi:MAG: FecR family protein [Steroidobacter sp.]
MDNRGNADYEELLVAERAAEWLDRLKTAGPRERAAFMQWLKESPGHIREMLLAAACDAALRNIDPRRRIDLEQLRSASAQNVVPVRGARFPVLQATYRGARRTWMAGLAAGFACLAVVLFVSPGLYKDLLHPGQYTTAVGEQRAIKLPDGSVIDLNTQSSVQVNFSARARDVYLGAGQAMFAVAHDETRPFRVHVGPAVIQAIGTKFDVRRLADRTDVAVIEGLVQIKHETSRGSPDTTLAEISERTRLAAGEAASIALQGQVTPPAPVDIAQVSAWQQRRLIFRNDTLAEIVDEFSRYNRTPQIRIEGDELRAKRFSGVFDADDPESLVAYLESDDALAFERQGRELVIRIRPGVAESAR